MPIDNRVNAHERRPSMISGVKMRQKLTVGISPSGAHQHSLNLLMSLQILREGGLERQRDSVYREIVATGTGSNERVHLRECLWRRNETSGNLLSGTTLCVKDVDVE